MTLPRTPGAQVHSVTAAPKKMKNVLVLYSHNASADFLSTQHLKNDFSSNLDTARCMESPDPELMDGFSTDDGIQFFHFKRAYREYHPEEFDARMEWMKHYIEARGEQLDAIVLPASYGHNYENEAFLEQLKEMKAVFPGVKVLACYAPSKLYEDDTQVSRTFTYANSFAVDESPLPKNDYHDKRHPYPITKETPGYRLAGPIDMLCDSMSGHIDDQLRALIDLPPYAAKSRGV